MLGDDAYVTPAADPAPWIDTARPDSLKFAGMQVLSVSGVEGSPWTRVVYEGAGDGGTLGRLRLGIRRVVVRGLLMGETCCGTAYGLRWLSSVLRGAACQDCEGDDLCFLQCCPDCDPVTEACADPYVRTLKRVGLVDGPNVTRRYGQNCGCGGCPMLEVEFTLDAAVPWQYRPTELVATDVAPVLNDCGCDIIWTTVVPTGDTELERNQSLKALCLACLGTVCNNLGCEAILVPGMPKPRISCGCALPFNATHTVVGIGTGDMDEWHDSVVLAEITAGANTDLRNVVIKFHDEPAIGGCTTDDCPCDGFVVAHVPKNSVLTVDGLERRVTLYCKGQTIPAEQLVSGIDAPFEYPVLSCKADSCLTVTWDCAFTSSDAKVNVWLAVREP